MLNSYLEKINKGIVDLLPSQNASPYRLHEAMHYSMQAEGKRLRPLLLIAAHATNEYKHNPLPAAIAVECIHTYSLIHDDLPCMDDANQRRSKATNHKQFDEATALLAGDALLTYAFELISEYYRDQPRLANELTRDLSSAAGSRKLIGAQMLDLISGQEVADSARLEAIHAGKTSAMITTSITMGLRLGEASTESIRLGQQLGYYLGMAFQITDDILDCTSEPELLGKDSGRDRQLNKLTYPSLYGLDVSQQKAEKYIEKALLLCDELGGDNRLLSQTIDSMTNRVY